MTDLSPAAQAVVDAYTSTPIKNGALPAIAAALRAAGNHCTHDRLTLYCLADELDNYD